MKHYNKTLKLQLLLGLLVLLTTSLLTACGQNSQPIVSVPNTPATPVPTPPGLARVAVGSPAPDFQASDINSQSVQLSTLRGKAVVVNYWSVY